MRPGWLIRRVSPELSSKHDGLSGTLSGTMLGELQVSVHVSLLLEGHELSELIFGGMHLNGNRSVEGCSHSMT